MENCKIKVKREKLNKMNKVTRVDDDYRLAIGNFLVSG